MSCREHRLEERYGQYLERPLSQIVTFEQAIEVWQATEDADLKESLIEKAFELCATYNQARTLRGCTELGSEQWYLAQRMVIHFCVVPDQAYCELTDARASATARMIGEIEKSDGATPVVTEPEDISSLQAMVLDKVDQLLGAAGF